MQPAAKTRARRAGFLLAILFLMYVAVARGFSATLCLGGCCGPF